MFSGETRARPAPDPRVTHLGSRAIYPLVESWAPCRVCGSEALRALHVYKSRRKISSERFLALLGCEACGFVQSVPTPPREVLDAWYTEPHGWESRSADDEEKLARWAKKKGRRYAGRLELLSPHLRPPGAAPAVLDVGCGLGSWLDVLQDAGWRTHGIEPGPKQARIAARRHTMLDAAPADERFDLAIVNHVLEHLLDPLAVVREIAGSIAPGGQLFVSVPDFGRVHLHRDLPYVASDVHLNSFSFSGLRSLLALGGLEVEQHFESPEWAAIDDGAPIRLRVLARKTGAVGFPTEAAPLEQAVYALRSLGRIESEEEDEGWRAKREARAPGA